MIKLEEILQNITVDLKLGVTEQIDFENQFAQLLAFNILLSIPDQYKGGIKGLLDNIDSIDQNILIKKITDLGITREQATLFLDESIRKTISEIVQKYDDVLSLETKDNLQQYIS